MQIFDWFFSLVPTSKTNPVTDTLILAKRIDLNFFNHIHRSSNKITNISVIDTNVLGYITHLKTAARYMVEDRVVSVSVFDKPLLSTNLVDFFTDKQGLLLNGPDTGAVLIHSIIEFLTIYDRKVLGNDITPENSRNGALLDRFVTSTIGLTNMLYEISNN